MKVEQKEERWLKANLRIKVVVERLRAKKK